MALQQDGIRPSGVNPSYLHANSTAHIWIFGAFAELIDNAYDPDVNASKLWIDKLDYGKTPCLRFLDNGAGMDKNKLYEMLSFGYCDKRIVKPTESHKPIGQYGNGFKSGSMRIGKDALVFTRTKDSASIGFLSQTYLKAIKAKSVIVPMMDYSLPNLERGQSQEIENNLRAILRHSVFSSEEELKDELRTLGEFETGTKILISNFVKLPDGQLEFDFTRDPTDILCPEADTSEVQNRLVAQYSLKYKSSLRDYCTILFLEPKMTIHIRGKTVRSKSVSYSLNDKIDFYYRPRNEEKSIRITFGFTSEDEKTENYGMMLYHRNRLIKAFERVGCQKQSHNTHGTGVVGVAEVDFLEPIHTKQDFIRNEMFNNAMKSFGEKLNRYWDMKRTTRVLRNTKNRRSGRGDSRDPAANLTPHEREINLGILDNLQSPVNQNQTQKSHSIGGIGMALRDEGRATNNQADSPVQRTEEPTSSVHAQREMSAAQSKQELKTETNELQTDIDKSNIEEVEMSAAHKIEELETEINELRAEIDKLKKEKVEINLTQERERHEWKEVKNELRTEIDKLDKEKNEMSDTQETETHELNMEISDLRKKIAKMHSENVEMSKTQQVETHKLKKKINELRTEITKLKSEKNKMIDTQETETHKLTKEIKELKTEIDTLKREKNELTSEKRYGSKRKKMS